MATTTPKARSRRSKNIGRLPTPFVKWAGGKSQILNRIEDILPIDYNGYVEPFVGGGAVYFWLWRMRRLSSRRPIAEERRPLLCDLNKRLVNTYRAIRDESQSVMNELDTLMARRDRESYYQLRSEWKHCGNGVYDAALFIYFNKMCYNGLYRVNKDQEFNVPWGKRENTPLYVRSNLVKVSEALQDCDLLVGDFEDCEPHIPEDCLVYFDPPYHFPSSTNGFTGYTSEGFDDSEQTRLAKMVHRLNEKGCKIIISNSDTPLTRKLYSRKRGLHVERINARRVISCDPNGRGTVTEVLVRNYPNNETQQTRLVTQNTSTG